MPVSEFDQIMAGAYNSLTITPFSLPPQLTKSPDADPNITIAPQGWVDDRYMAVIVTTVNYYPRLSINREDHSILFMYDANQGNGTVNWYYLFDYGSTGGNNSDWSITFVISGGTTGSWVFTKKKVGDPPLPPVHH